MKKYTVIDLFAGCGGLSEGFEKSKYFELAAYVEWEKSPCETLVNRLQEKWKIKNAREKVLRFDLQKIKYLLNGWNNDPHYGTGKGLKNIIRPRRTVDIIVGGPPCQAYSIAGRVRDENGMRLDYRNYLFESYIHIVRHFSPKLILFENVTGMLSAKPNGFKIIDKVKNEFDKAGYEILDELKRAVVDFSDYGIPQNRKRLIIIGIKKTGRRDNQKLLDIFYESILKSLKVHKKTTVQNAIGDLPKLYPVIGKNINKNGRKHSHEPFTTRIDNHYPRYHSKRDINIFRDLANDILSGAKQFVSVKALQKFYTERTGNSSSVHKYYVLRRDSPSNLIPAHLYKDGLRHIHPDPKQARSITVREAARLQGFPDDFEFLGSMTDQYKMIGNAVPPRFSEVIALSLVKLMKLINT
jgi:DNA (cytosine-5)-methyltransferase 1